jgi:hypothetical protein
MGMIFRIAQKTDREGSTTSSIIIGVFVGALVSFSVQFYSDFVQDRRTQRSERTNHIERAMTAASDLERAEVAFVLRLFTVGASAKNRIVPDLSSALPETSAINELHMLTVLYLPEIKEEVHVVATHYNEWCNSVGKTVLQKILNFQPGEQFDPAAFGIEQAKFAQMQGHVKKLQDKLLELSKKNQ